MTTLFQRGEFTLHSGAKSRWRINCDALTDEDWATLAFMLSEVLPPFGEVRGIATGGTKLALAMVPYLTPVTAPFGQHDLPPLIVDDVYTTGGSFITALREVQDEEWQRPWPHPFGAVVFARCPAKRILPWVTPLFVRPS